MRGAALRALAGLAGLAACWHAAAVAQELELAYRGYAELVGDGYRVNRAAAANPDNVLGLRSSGVEAVGDVFLSAAYGNFSAAYEHYGTLARDGGGRQAKPYQAYVSVTSDDQAWFVRAGKVVPSWGVGQIWNPVRAITNEGRRDLITPSRAVEGVSVVQLQHVLDADSSVSALVLPGEDGRARGYALRYSSARNGIDYAVSVYGNERAARKAGLELSWILGPATLVGEATWANSSDAGVVRPGGGVEARGRGRRVSYVAGVSVVLPEDRQLTVEYFHDGEAYSRAENAEFVRALPASLGLYKPLGNGRDSVYAGLSQRILRNNSSIGLGAFHNVQSKVSMWRLSGETQLGGEVRLLVNVSRYREPCCRRAVNLYSTMLDARLRWSF